MIDFMFELHWASADRYIWSNIMWYVSVMMGFLFLVRLAFKLMDF
jgi:hypothetical protein